MFIINFCVVLGVLFGSVKKPQDGRHDQLPRTKMAVQLKWMSFVAKRVVVSVIEHLVLKLSICWKIMCLENRYRTKQSA